MHFSPELRIQEVKPKGFFCFSIFHVYVMFTYVFEYVWACMCSDVHEETSDECKESLWTTLPT